MNKIMENLNREPFDFIKSESKPTTSDKKINDSMILLSKKIDEIIEYNQNLKNKINSKASFIENQYFWQIEDLESKLSKKIEKSNAQLKAALKKIDSTHIAEHLNVQKTADIDFIKAKNKVLIERLEKNENDSLLQTKITNIFENEIKDVSKVTNYYENLIKVESQNVNLDLVKKIKLDHDNKIKFWKKEFELKKKEILSLNAQTENDRKKAAAILRKSFEFKLLANEKVTNIQVLAHQNYLAVFKIQNYLKNELSNLVEKIKKSKSRKLFKEINALEKKIFEIENLKITKTIPIVEKEAYQISKLRLAKINEGIKNNINIVAKFTDQEMLPDLVPSYHTYKINPLIAPNNTYFAHKHHGVYKGIKFSSALFGLGIGILLMVLYTLFSIQSSKVWINTGAEAQGNAIASVIFSENMNLGFAELYNLWNMSATYWTAILWIGIILLVTSSLTVAMRNHTLWSYCAISAQIIFIIIGFALMVDTFVKMDFGLTTMIAEKETLIMINFRELIGLVQAGNSADAISVFEDLITALGGEIPVWNVPDLLNN